MSTTTIKLGKNVGKEHAFLNQPSYLVESMVMIWPCFGHGFTNYGGPVQDIFGEPSSNFMGFYHINTVMSWICPFPNEKATVYYPNISVGFHMFPLFPSHSQSGTQQHTVVPSMFLCRYHQKGSLMDFQLCNFDNYINI